MTVLVVLVIVIGGYLGYRYIKESLSVSADLAGLSNRDSVLAHVIDKSPAPPAGSKLTGERVELYVGAFDSVSRGWRALTTALDTVKSQNDSGESIGSFKTWVNKSVLREIVRLPLVSRRGLVNYLNMRHLSWAEYVWIKERTIAASMITRGEYDSAMLGEMRAHFPANDNKKSKGLNAPSPDELFRRIEEIRSSGGLDSTEIALVAPHRRELLSTGLPSLMGLDTDLDNQTDVSVNDGDEE